MSKSFGWGTGRTLVLDQVSFDVPETGVYGLLGPNGAGKSTLLRIICGLLRHTGGDVRLFGEKAAVRSRSMIGVLVDSPTFYPFMSARQFLNGVADVAGVKAETDGLLKLVDLTRAADQRISGFSLGMRQRLGIACALVGRPRAVILDEPTNGLDPDGMIEMRGLIQRLSYEEGVAVLLSSHLLDEVEKIADRVVILNQGRVVAEGQVSDLLGRQEYLWLDVRPAEAVVARLGSVARLEDDGVAVTIAKADGAGLLKSLILQGFEVREAKWIRPNLESFFLAETRRPEGMRR
ncbi:ABC transporter ATP-binding protein [Rhizobium sp. FKY42]|uniref:ABC transporter ATP-binding protein n=1 Tax=Rhizobium sp. FKY42 TaxID=2562310 RepID=UPI0024849A60|nr:ABC transporter ATP-binding protein [Rhizobium sp. FKY42]